MVGFPPAMAPTPLKPWLLPVRSTRLQLGDVSGTGGSQGWGCVRGHCDPVQRTSINHHYCHLLFCLGCRCHLLVCLGCRATMAVPRPLQKPRRPFLVWHWVFVGSGHRVGFHNFFLGFPPRLLHLASSLVRWVWVAWGVFFWVAWGVSFYCSLPPPPRGIPVPEAQNAVLFFRCLLCGGSGWQS